MATPRIPDLTVAPFDGQTTAPIVVDGSTEVGLFIQLRGVAISVTTAALTLKMGSASVSPSVTIASGQVTATVSAANVTTLNARPLQAITAWWSGTYTDGSDTREWKYEQTLVVTDRLTRLAINYDNLVLELPEMGKACSLPDGQTNWWPQVRLAYEKFLQEMSTQSGIQLAQITDPSQLAPAATAYILWQVSRVMYRHVQGQGSGLANDIAFFEKEFHRLWSATLVNLKRNQETFGTKGAKEQTLLKRVNMMQGNSGGPL